MIRLLYNFIRIAGKVSSSVYQPNIVKNIGSQKSYLERPKYVEKTSTQIIIEELISVLDLINFFHAQLRNVQSRLQNWGYDIVGWLFYSLGSFEDFIHVLNCVCTDIQIILILEIYELNIYEIHQRSLDDLFLYPCSLDICVCTHRNVCVEVTC